MTRYGKPACRPKCSTGTTCGWASRAIAAASVRNRSRAAGVAYPPASITFTATARPSTKSRARYTTPMPPRPSSASTSYPGSSGRSATAAPSWGRVVAGSSPLTRAISRASRSRRVVSCGHSSTGDGSRPAARASCHETSRSSSRSAGSEAAGAVVRSTGTSVPGRRRRGKRRRPNAGLPDWRPQELAKMSIT